MFIGGDLGRPPFPDRLKNVSISKFKGNLKKKEMK